MSIATCQPSLKIFCLQFTAHEIPGRQLRALSLKRSQSLWGQEQLPPLPPKGRLPPSQVLLVSQLCQEVGCRVGILPSLLCWREKINNLSFHYRKKQRGQETSPLRSVYVSKCVQVHHLCDAVMCKTRFGMTPFLTTAHHCSTTGALCQEWRRAVLVFIFPHLFVLNNMPHKVSSIVAVHAKIAQYKNTI